MAVKQDISVRFWSKVYVDGPLLAHVVELGQCWMWTGARFRQGYGQINIGRRRNDGAHRLSWRLNCGAIPDGLRVCHHCDNPGCVRPGHLFLATAKGNFEDMCKKGRRKIATGDRRNFARHPEQLPRGENHRCAKLTEERVRHLRARVAAGERQVDLAREVGISRSSMSSLILRESWKHVS